MNNLQKIGQLSVHKFGGSSLSSSDSYEHIKKVISDNCKPGDWIVVSAAGKTTNLLLSVATNCISSPEKVIKELMSLQTYQTGLLKAAQPEYRSLLLVNTRSRL